MEELLSYVAVNIKKIGVRAFSEDEPQNKAQRL
jgi:hypothetical protein